MHHEFFLKILEEYLATTVPKNIYSLISFAGNELTAKYKNTNLTKNKSY